MQLRDTALVLICSFLIATQSNAAQPRLFQSPLSNNLIESTVSAIHRDSQGVLWIGTKRGLHRFDGSAVTIFSSKMTNRNWIPANVIYDIAEDREGNLLVATKGGGLLEWSKSSQQFEVSAISKANKEADFVRVYTSVQGNIWLGTEDDGTSRRASQG
jgi:ligand-binding sensor domain-containing protein